MIPINMHKYAPNLDKELVKEVQDNANAVWHIVPEVCRRNRAHLKTLLS